jgi:hypothetical protein
MFENHAHFFADELKKYVETLTIKFRAAVAQVKEEDEPEHQEGGLKEK